MTLAQFDALYARRHQPQSLLACLALSHSAPSEFEWLWRAARLEQFVAMQALQQNERANARTHFARGRDFGAQAAKLDALRVEGVFWEATCALEAARLSNPLAMLAILKGSERALERAMALDENYHFAAPVRVLGRLTQLKPLALGGNLDNALAFYTRALQLAPGCSTTLLYRADALLHDHQPGEARATLKRVLNASDDGWEWETARDKELARQWLQTRLD